jgi:molecular chaperone HscB
MQQMEWREAVESAKAAKNEPMLDVLTKQKRTEEASLFTSLSEQLSGGANMIAAKETVRKLRFLEKLGEEIDIATESLET